MGSPLVHIADDR